MPHQSKFPLNTWKKKNNKLNFPATWCLKSRFIFFFLFKVKNIVKFLVISNLWFFSVVIRENIGSSGRQRVDDFIVNKRTFHSLLLRMTSRKRIMPTTNKLMIIWINLDLFKLNINIFCEAKAVTSGRFHSYLAICKRKHNAHN